MLRPPLRRALGLLGLLLAAALPASAQVVSGTVADSASRLPLAGAVVQLLGPANEERGRSLSAADGSFSIRATGSVRSVRVVRIGFRPWSQPVEAATDAALRLDVAMARIPAFLDARQITAAACRPRRNRGRSPIGLIDQARAGLLTSIVTRDQNPAAMTRVTYERRFEGESNVPSTQVVLLDSATRQTRTFRAAQAPDAFVRRGFSEVIGGERLFYAPDAEVLLDDRFAEGYCFHVMPPDRSRPREVGLGFEVAKREGGRVDVEGALWIDTVARELRALEFRYVGLERRIEVLEPGGTIGFHTLPNGMVVVDRWQLRLVGATVDSQPAPRGAGVRETLRLFRVESGGELGSAQWRDGTQFTPRLGRIVGRVRLDDDEVAAGIPLRLAGTPYRTVTDSTGAFRIADVLPGSYRLVAEDPSLMAIGLVLPTGQPVTSDRDSIELAVTLPARFEVVMDRCRALGRFDPRTRTVFLGRVLDAAGQPVAGARWDVRLRVAGAWEEIVIGARTGSDGLMPLCSGLLRGSEIEISVQAPDERTALLRQRLSEAATIVALPLPRP